MPCIGTLCTWEQYLQTILQGLTIGSIYALVALGYTLVYGIIELINFAHGDLFMLGSFSALTVVEWTITGKNHFPVPAWLGLLMALVIPMMFCASLNVVIERVAYRRLRNAPRLAPLISAIGVSFILINIGLWWRGPNPQNFPALLSVFGQENLIGTIFGSELGSKVRFTFKDVSVILVTIPLLLLLNYVVYRTNIGKAMRATAQDREAASLMGINVNRTIAFTFLLGGALAGAAGLIFGIYTGSTHFFRGFDSGLKAFTAAVLGGIGNLFGATLGGYLIGLIAAFSDRIFGSNWTSATIFAILILILVFRPGGLMGEQTTEKV
jgi:branched-chain amino acid transport system permease protein